MMIDQDLHDVGDGDEEEDALQYDGDTIIRMLAEYGVDTSHADDQKVASLIHQFPAITPEHLASFWDVWQTIPADFRTFVLGAVHDMAKEDVTYQVRHMFIRCLDDAEPDVRAIALDGLGEDDDPETLNYMLAFAHDSAVQVRVAALNNMFYFIDLLADKHLTNTQREAMMRTLLDTFDNDSEDAMVRGLALEALSVTYAFDMIDTPTFEDMVSFAYEHESEHMQQSALMAMGYSMLPQWLPTIEKSLHSSTPAICQTAIRASGEMFEEGRPLVQHLIPFVNDEDQDMACAALWALGQIGGKDARAVLERTTHSKDPARAETAQEALSELLLFSEENDVGLGV